MKNNTAYTIWLYYILLVAIWGSSFILIKTGLKGYSIWQAATIRLLSALFVMGGVAIGHLKKIPRKTIKVVMLVGLINMFIPSYLFCMAQTHIPSAMAGIFNALTPLFTTLISLLVFKKSISKRKWSGLVLGLVSILFLLIYNAHGKISFNVYALLIIAATICYALNINIVKIYLSDVPALYVTSVAVSFSGLLAIPIFIFTGYDSYINIASTQIIPLLSLLILGIIGTALAQWIQNQLINKSSAIFASSTTYLIPVVAIFLGLMNGEVLGYLHYIGISSILFGVYLLNKK